MPYHFPPDVAKLVEQCMTRGKYASEDDLLRDALRALDGENFAGDEDAAVVEGIARGLDQMKQGLGRDVDQFDREFRAKRKIS